MVIRIGETGRGEGHWSFFPRMRLAGRFKENEMTMRAAKLLFVCACIAMMGARPAAAEMTVGMLETLCKSKEQQDEIACGSYLLGVMDAYKSSATQYGARIPFCYPKSGLSAKDISLAFRLWASTNPGEEKKSAIAGIIASMTERFPCQQKKSNAP